VDEQPDGGQTGAAQAAVSSGPKVGETAQEWMLPDSAVVEVPVIDDGFDLWTLDGIPELASVEPTSLRVVRGGGEQASPGRESEAQARRALFAIIAGGLATAAVFLALLPRMTHFDSRKSSDAVNVAAHSNDVARAKTSFESPAAGTEWTYERTLDAGALPAADSREPEAIGIAECDDYLRRALACEKVPESARMEIRRAVVELSRGSTRELAADECRRLNAALDDLGCPRSPGGAEAR
jgi:hypothetical protein